MCPVSVAGDLPGPVGSVLKSQLKVLVGERDAATVNEEFLVAHQLSLPHLLAGE